LVLYHAGCCDGFTAAWCAWKKHGDQADYLPVQYGQPPPDVTDRNVDVLDFCYPHDVLQEMARKARLVRVLDHHKSRARDMAGRYWKEGDEEKEFSAGFGNLICFYHPKKSGARLAWEHYHGGKRSPWLVDYVEDRDLWRWDLPRSKALNAAIRSYDFDFRLWDEWASWGGGVGENVFGNELWNMRLGHLACEGAGILRAQDKLLTDICKTAREVCIGGHQVRAANTSCLFSEVAEKLAEGMPFGAAWFQRSDGKFQWSLRSREGGVDVSEVARAYGGGEHAAAAGFETVAIHPELRKNA
jgi:oligoribonuclease NrnB/cAMP/cGMP phosphodiesterase (DHH superfamily)